jgi:tRNA A-37 threonylcarbamoyl transferase component Bud32
MKEFIKYIRAPDKRTIDREYETQVIASKYDFAPKIYEYTVTYDPNKKYYEGKIVMENLEEMCIADMYGDNAEDIPLYVWEQMRDIIKILYNNEGIEYIDITGYNFIEKDEKVYIIDFGHAKYSKKKTLVDPFLEKFMNGANEFNPEFK